MRAIRLWAIANRTLLHVQLGRTFVTVWMWGARALPMAADWPHPARYRLVQLAWVRFT